MSAPVEVWLLPAVLAAVLIGCYGIYQTYLLTEVHRSPIHVNFVSHVVAAVLLLAGSVLAGAVEPIPPAVAAALGVSVVFNVLSFGLYTRALAIGDLGDIAPIRNMAPIPIALIEPALFGFGLEVSAVFAAALAAAGGYIISVRSGVRLSRNRAVLLAAASVAFIVGATFADRFGVQQVDSLFYSGVLIAGVAAVFAWGHMRDPDRDPVALIDLPSGVIRAVDVGLALYVLSITRATNFSVVVQLSVPVQVAAGYVLFGERGLGKKLLGGALIVVGVVLVTQF